MNRVLSLGASALIVLVCTLLAMPSTMATEDPSLCIDLMLECVDGPAPAGYLPIRGTVMNCGDEAIAYVRVRDAIGGGNWYLDGISLDPGQSASWSGLIAFNYSDCPVEVKVVAYGWAAGLSRFAQDLELDYCECPPSTDVCRTAGFYGTHGGTEKRRSGNITQEIIEAAPGGLLVCGEVIDTTNLDVFGSAQESLCVSPEGEQNLQLARQLTAAALNCVMSGSLVGCDGTSIEGLFDHCNDVCMAGTDADEIDNCESAVDCWNNGGIMLANGMCQLGTCEIGEAPCKEDADCGMTAEGMPIACVPLAGTCHDRLLVNEGLGLDFSDPGPAGSSRACNRAKANDCTIFEGCGD